jgi:hypothetical protein
MRRFERSSSTGLYLYAIWGASDDGEGIEWHALGRLEFSATISGA